MLFTSHITIAWMLSLYIFGHIHHVNVRRFQFFGHVHQFRSFSFGHLDSVKWITLNFLHNKIMLSIFDNLLHKNAPHFYNDCTNNVLKTESLIILETILTKLLTCLHITSQFFWNLKFQWFSDFLLRLSVCKHEIVNCNLILIFLYFLFNILFSFLTVDALSTPLIPRTYISRSSKIDPTEGH